MTILSLALSAAVQLAACRHSLSPVLLASIAAHETNLDATKIGRLGEVGRWQILPATARFLGYHGTDAGLAKDAVNAWYAAEWLAYSRQVCARRGITEPASWISKYTGDRCRPTRYSRAVLEIAGKANES